MLKDAAADDVTSGSVTLVSYVVIWRKPMTGSGDVGDKKQKSWLGYCPDSGIDPNWDFGIKTVKQFSGKN